MEAVPAFGKLSRVSPQIDCPSVAGKSGSLRDDIEKHVLSEPFALEVTSIIDETRDNTAVVVSSPVSKRVRFADSVPGRSLLDMCPADLKVSSTQGNSSLPVTSESVPMDVNECCSDHEMSSIHNNNHEVCTPVLYRVVRDHR